MNQRYMQNQMKRKSRVDWGRVKWLRLRYIWSRYLLYWAIFLWDIRWFRCRGWRRVSLFLSDRAMPSLFSRRRYGTAPIRRLYPMLPDRVRFLSRRGVLFLGVRQSGKDGSARLCGHIMPQFLWARAICDRKVSACRWCCSSCSGELYPLLAQHRRGK